MTKPENSTIRRSKVGEQRMGIHHRDGLEISKAYHTESWRQKSSLM